MHMRFEVSTTASVKNVVRQKFTDVSEEHTASMFRVKKV
jgi:hypothetical protein